MTEQHKEHVESMKTCEGCGRRELIAKSCLYCKQCVQANISFYAHPPKWLTDQNQTRIFGKVLTDKEFADHMQQKNDTD